MDELIGKMVLASLFFLVISTAYLEFAVMAVSFTGLVVSCLLAAGYDKLCR